MSVLGPSGILVEVETAVPTEFVVVDDLTKVDSGTTSPVTRTRAFGKTYRTRGTKEITLTFDGLLNAADPGQTILLAKAALGTQVKIRVSEDSPGNTMQKVYTGTVEATTHNATAEEGSLQTVTYEMDVQSVTDTSLIPLTRFVSSDALEPGVTFVRASIGTYHDGAGFVQTAASGVRRSGQYYPVGALDGTLLEEQRTNLCLQSQNFADASWTKLNASITPTVSSPDGGTNAQRITGNTGVTTNGIEQSLGSFSAGEQLSLSVSVKTGTVPRCVLYAKNGAIEAGVIINPATGALTNYTAGGGTVFHSFSYLERDGWYRCCVTVALSSVVTAVWRLVLADAAGTIAYSTNEHVFAFGAQGEKNARCASSYIVTTSGTVTRSADVLTLPLPWTPRAFTILTEAIDMGTGRIADARLVAVGGLNQVVQNSASGLGQYNIQRNFPGWVGTGPAATTANGDRFEVRGVLLDTGGQRAGISINAGAETTSQDLTTAAIPASWGGTPHIAVGYDGGGVAMIRKIKILNGEQSLTTMRSIP